MKINMFCALILSLFTISCASQSKDSNTIVKLQAPQEVVIFSKDQDLKENDQLEFYWESCETHYIQVRQKHSHCEEKSIVDGVVVKDLGSGQYLIKTASLRKIDKRDKFRKKGA